MKKVIILVGGIAGLSTAIALQRIGMDVRVFEKTAELKPFGAGIILAPNVVRIFEEWGMTQQLIKHRADLHNILLQALKSVPVYLGKKAAGYQQQFNWRHRVHE